MSRVWSVLVVVVACLVAVNFAAAQEKKEKGKHGDHQSPEQRWDAIAKGADKAGATELTKDEFVKGIKAANPRMGDRAEGFFKHIKKASEDKVTKDEFVAAAKAMREKMKDHKPGEHKGKK